MTSPIVWHGGWSRKLRFTPSPGNRKQREKLE